MLLQPFKNKMEAIISVTRDLFSGFFMSVTYLMNSYHATSRNIDSWALNQAENSFLIKGFS